MAALTPDFVRALNADVISIYEEAFKGTSGLATKLATFIPASQKTENYSFISDIPIMREFIEERKVRGIKDYGFTIRDRKWEATIGIERDAIEDDATGQIRLRVQTLADSGMAHYDRLLFDVINANGTAYDGTAFYHANHNNLAVAALSASAIEDGIAAMMDQTTPIEGEPMDVMPNVLLVPPQIYFDAKRFLNSAYWPDSSGAGAFSKNVLAEEQIEVVWSSRLATNTEWHLLDCRKRVKPFIISQRIEPKFSTPNPGDFAEGMESHSSFHQDILEYGIRSRDNAGVGLYQYAYKSTGGG
jgi:phage major head subunit gpT-like protein